MNDKCHKQSIEIVLDRESPVYKEICKIAKRENESVESVVEFIVCLSLRGHMERNLKFVNRTGCKNVKGATHDEADI